MSSKKFDLASNLEITITKRSSSRRIRLSITSDGNVRASIPPWLPYKSALDFAKSKIDWIESKLPEKVLLTNGRAIGKNHRLIFELTKSTKPTTRLTSIEAKVFYPANLSIEDDAIQLAAKRIIKKALTKQAETLLPIRLKQLADQYGYSYENVSVKSLKTRWGSCDRLKNITLNIYLMELPWPLIDYVLLHELNHTNIMQHGPKFWQALELKLPNYPELKKQLRNYPTYI